MEKEKVVTIVKSEMQEWALELMMLRQTNTQIVKVLGVKRQTLYNWGNLDERFLEKQAC